MYRNLQMFLIFIVLINSNLFGQIKIGTGIYLYHDPDHVARKYNMIVFRTNTVEDINATILKCASNEGINMLSYNSLFPPLREYSEEERKKKYDEKGVDGFCSVEFSYDQSFRSADIKTTTNGNTTNGKISLNSMQSIYFRVFFFDREMKDTPYAKIEGAYHDLAGGPGNRVIAITKGIIYKSLKGMKKNNLIISN